MAQKLFLGIDIGTYETKGVLVDNAGNIISQAAKKHEMIVPQVVGQSTDLWKIGGVISLMCQKN